MGRSIFDPKGNAAAILIGCLFAAVPIASHAADPIVDEGKLASQLIQCGVAMMMYSNIVGPYRDEDGFLWDAQSVEAQIEPKYLEVGAYIYIHKEVGTTISADTPVSGAVEKGVINFSEVEATKAAELWLSLLQSEDGKSAFDPYWQTCSTLAVLGEFEMSKFMR